MKTHRPLLRTVFSGLLLATFALPAANAQLLYEDSFTLNPGALNGRTTASGFGSWVNTDSALQTGGGLMTVSTNLPVDYHSATFALPALSGPDILTVSITTRPVGTFLGIGFTEFAGQFVNGSGFSWLYIDAGGVQIFRGIGSADPVSSASPALPSFNANLSPSIPTTYSFTYNPANKTMGLSATNGSNSAVFFSALDISGLPSAGFNNFALQFQGQNLSTDSTPSYVSNIRAEVVPEPSVNLLLGVGALTLGIASVRRLRGRRA